jgi:hypothetical protein
MTEQEQRKQRLPLAGAEARQRLAVCVHREWAKEADDERRNGGSGRSHAGG